LRSSHIKNVFQSQYEKKRFFFSQALVVQEAEIRRNEDGSQPGKIVLETLS
jgi:hypothetical protein